MRLEPNKYDFGVKINIAVTGRKSRFEKELAWREAMEIKVFDAFEILLYLEQVFERIDFIHYFNVSCLRG